jgi:hypothetical protein
VKTFRGVVFMAGHIGEHPVGLVSEASFDGRSDACGEGGESYGC